MRNNNSEPSMVAATFDVDRTLVPLTTTERVFIRYLIRKGAIGPLGIARMVLRSLRKFPLMSPFEAMRQERSYLAGQPVEKMKRLARQCFETDIKPRISQAGMKAIREHKAHGETVILLSGSLDFLLEPLREYVAADHLIGARMEVINGRLTGRIAGPWPFGPQKVLIIQHFAQEHGLDFSRSYCYADHHTDHDILRLFGNPVVINPRRKMREIAQREGWPVKEFK